MQDEERLNDGQDDVGRAGDGAEERAEERAGKGSEGGSAPEAHGEGRTAGGHVVRRLIIGRVEGDLRIKGRSALGFEIEPPEGGDAAPSVSWNGTDVTVDSPVGCDISIPGSASVHVREVEGALRIKGVAGDVVIGVVGRDVGLKNVGTTRIETVGERLKVRGVAGDLNASTIGGSADIQAVAGDVRLATIGGSLDLAGVQGAVGASVGGSARVDRSLDQNSALRLTAGGSIECTVPEDIGADIRAAAGGTVRIDLPEIDIVGGVQHYSGAVGGGGTPIELTAGGSIRIVGATDGPPRVAFERSDEGVDATERDYAEAYEHAHHHAHVRDESEADERDEHGSGRGRRRTRGRVRDAADDAWEADEERGAPDGPFEKEISRLVREAAGRLDGLAVEINASVAEALASLPGALESAGLNEDHAARLSARLQRIGERATERAERQIKRAMHRAEREVGRVGRRAGDAPTRGVRHLRKVVQVRQKATRPDRTAPGARSDAPPAATGEEIRSVLRMLEAGSITADQAERILSALEPNA